MREVRRLVRHVRRRHRGRLRELPRQRHPLQGRHLTLTLPLPLTPNQVWPLFKWNVDYIIIGYLARETQALTPNP